MCVLRLTHTNTHTHTHTHIYIYTHTHEVCIYIYNIRLSTHKEYIEIIIPTNNTAVYNIQHTAQCEYIEFSTMCIASAEKTQNQIYQFYQCDNKTYIYIHSFINIQPWRPGLAGTRAQPCDRYGSGTLHTGQVLGGSLPLLFPAFTRSNIQIYVRVYI